MRIFQFLIGLLFTLNCFAQQANTINIRNFNYILETTVEEDDINYKEIYTIFLVNANGTKKKLEQIPKVEYKKNVPKEDFFMEHTFNISEKGLLFNRVNNFIHDEKRITTKQSSLYIVLKDGSLLESSSNEDGTDYKPYYDGDFRKYVQTRFHYTDEITDYLKIKNLNNLTLRVSFYIDENGKVVVDKIRNPTESEAVNNHVIAFFEKMDNWVPAKLNGKYEKAIISMPISLSRY
jgi:hypothetical protein